MASNSPGFHRLNREDWICFGNGVLGDVWVKKFFRCLHIIETNGTCFDCLIFCRVLGFQLWFGLMLLLFGHSCESRPKLKKNTELAD